MDTNPSLKTDLADKITTREWKFVERLIADVNAEALAEEHCEMISSIFGQWRLAIKAFRRVEAKILTASTPTQTDLLAHRSCVTMLMSVGAGLLIACKNHQHNSFEKFGFSDELIESINKDLHNTLDEWHGQVSEAQLKDLRDKIFNGTPELNLQDSRA